MLGASIFAALMLVATIIHWDRFNHGRRAVPRRGRVLGLDRHLHHLAADGVRPVVAQPRDRPPCARPGEPLLSAGTLLAARAFAVVALAAAAVFFLSPATAIDIWPWTLTPLTARVLASFTAQVGVGALMLSFDRRWSTWRLIVETFFLATAFLLIGAARAWDDFDKGNVMTYLYIGGLVAADAALLILFLRTEASARAGDRPPTAPDS